MEIWKWFYDTITTTKRSVVGSGPIWAPVKKEGNSKPRNKCPLVVTEEGKKRTTNLGNYTPVYVLWM